MLRKSFKIVMVLMFVAVLFTQGCATVGSEALMDESETTVHDKIIEGTTTQAQIKKEFGSPSTTTFTDSGLEIWKYMLSSMSADATSYIPVVSLFAGSSSGVQKELTILFDQNDVVKKYNMSESDVTVRTGMFNQ